MVNAPEHGELEEQAARIRHAEQDAGLKPVEPDPDTVEVRETARGYRIGTEFVFTVLAFLFVGWALDRWLATEPLCLVLLVMAGFGVGMMNLWRAVNTNENDSAKGQENKE